MEGVSGFEFEVGNAVKGIFEKYCDFVEADTVGNVIGVIGRGRRRKVMIEAHLDEIGLMVQKIDEKGFVRFCEIGGINPATLPGAEVYIHGRERIFGVIGAKPPHLQTKEESTKNYKIEKMYIDTGFSADMLCDKIAVGDWITFVSKPSLLQNNRICAKSIDNRMGISCLIECMKRLKDTKTDFETVFLASVQEEVGCRGAKVGAYKIEPDFAIVVDVTHAETPYTESTDTVFPLGSGAAIAVGPSLNTALTQCIINTAKKREIPYKTEVCAANSGTDAWAIETTKKGIPCALISAPLKYMHTQVETVCLDDVKAVCDVICGAIEEGIHC